jgi:SAM-dependent methyltransferase
MNHAVVRYLEAKRTVDDRALSRRVRERLLAHLPAEPRVLEAGCGTGLTVPRLLAWGVKPGSYHGVDQDERVVAFARSVRPAAMRYAGHDVTVTDRGFTFEGAPVVFERGDALAAFENEGEADLLVAQAFADLVPIEAAIEAFEAAVRPGGLVYLPSTFDGGTIFQPDHPADAAVERAYHRAIDRQSGRDVHAGRHLAELLRRRPGDLLAMAASDWIVRPRDAVSPGEEGTHPTEGGSSPTEGAPHPGEGGSRPTEGGPPPNQRGPYPADERYFLDQILSFVASALAGESTVEGFEEWLATRREQLAAGRLTYVAHQYDLLYRTPEGPTP